MHWAYTMVSDHLISFEFTYWYSDIWPPYASYLAFEMANLEGQDDKLFICVKYNESYVDVFGCTGWCPYERFVKRFGAFAINSEEYVRLCNDGSQSRNYTQSTVVQDATMAQE